MNYRLMLCELSFVVSLNWLEYNAHDNQFHFLGLTFVCCPLSMTCLYSESWQKNYRDYKSIQSAEENNVKGVTDIKAPSACHSSQVLDRMCYSSHV